MKKKLNLKKISEKSYLKIERDWRILWLRNISFEGRIIIFKNLVLSKRVFLAEVLQNTGNYWDNTGIQKDFSRNWSITKIKHEAICNTFKMVD